MDNIENKEQLREGILHELAKIPARALSAEELLRRIRDSGCVDTEVSHADIRDALAFLDGYGFILSVPRMMSGLLDWRISTQGILYVESRNG